MKPLYTARAAVVGGREGRARTDDGRLDVAIAPPPELGGQSPEGTNPEQLFAAGYGSCFLSAVKLVARRMKLDADDAQITAVVDFGTIGGGAFGLAVELQVSLPGLAPEDARRLVEKAHEVCPYSNATRGNIEVKLTVTEAAVA